MASIFCIIEIHQWPHLNPETAARIAKEAEAKRLALVHFDANIYRTLKERVAAKKYAKKVYRNVSSAMDEIQLVL